MQKMNWFKRANEWLKFNSQLNDYGLLETTDKEVLRLKSRGKGQTYSTLRKFYFDNYIGTSEKGFKRYTKQIEDYGNFIEKFEKEHIYAK